MQMKERFFLGIAPRANAIVSHIATMKQGGRCY